MMKYNLSRVKKWKKEMKKLKGKGDLDLVSSKDCQPQRKTYILTSGRYSNF